MIEVKDLVKLYGERKVLHGLNFSVGVGRVCGFLGPNGAGKSTTMDILAGLLGPSDGTAKVCGLDVVTQTREVKEIVGYLPDNPPLYKEMTVVDFVTFVAKLRKISSADRKAAVDRVMTDCDVTDVASRLIGNLSKGYRQRVALCSALVHQPKVLILDEPTEGLDPNQIVLIRGLIRKLAKDRTVILSSHILSEVQATCDDVIIINQGQIAAQSSLADTGSSKPSLLYSFSDKPENALKWFKERTFVSKAEVFADRQNCLMIDFKDDFYGDAKTANLAQVNNQLMQQGFGLAFVQEHRTGLESLFFNAIKNQNSFEGAQQ
ncbi:MAG: ATP-binding cassette domain-containing protein [Proteobacteria bacterium]|jgi:ABC-2 type transport system ATP-binding protein|nr:ATP-binding cassette domain-containing protein [Pseudomonadota bacterium]